MAQPPSLKRLSSSSQSGSQSKSNQQSIVGFFQKKTGGVSAKDSQPQSQSTGRTKSATFSTKPRITESFTGSTSQSLTPAPSSDSPDKDDLDNDLEIKHDSSNRRIGLPSPMTSMSGADTRAPSESGGAAAVDFYSPSRKVHLPINPSYLS